MPLLFTFLIFVVLAVVISFAGMKLYVRPKEALERVTEASLEHQEAAPSHPSLAFPRFDQEAGSAGAGLSQGRHGNAAPLDPRRLPGPERAQDPVWDEGDSRRGLAAGGQLPHIGIVHDQSNKIMVILGAAGAGFFGPNEYVRQAAKRRQKKIQKGLANSLDLMVVCVESGLGLDQAILQVAKELEHAHPEISHEFAIVNLELKAESAGQKPCGTSPTGPASRTLKNWWPC